MKKSLLPLLVYLIAPLWVFPQLSVISSERIANARSQSLDPEVVGYNKFRAGDFLIFGGAGYGTEGLFNDITGAEIYSVKTVNLLPPFGVGFEYSLINSISLGSSFHYFRFKPSEFKDLPDFSGFSLFLMQFRYIVHYTFSRVDLYLGGTFGVYLLSGVDTSVSDLFKPNGNGGMAYSALAGLRIFFSDVFFLYGETAYPFPLAMGGIGFKL